MGVIQVIVARTNDSVRLVQCGVWNFVFLLKGPVYLVCVTRTDEPHEYVRTQLECLYSQVIFLLTSKAIEVLETNPSYDLRILLDDSTLRNCLSGVLRVANHTPAFLFEAVRCCKVPAATRAVANRVLSEVATNGLMYAMIIAGFDLVTLLQVRCRCGVGAVSVRCGGWGSVEEGCAFVCVCMCVCVCVCVCVTHSSTISLDLATNPDKTTLPSFLSPPPPRSLLSSPPTILYSQPKAHQIHPMDLLLLINFVNTMSSVRAAESWLQLCLPNLNGKAFLHAYIMYIADGVCLVMLTADGTIYSDAEKFSNLFQHLSLARQHISSALEDAKVIEHLSAAATESGRRIFGGLAEQQVARQSSTDVAFSEARQRLAAAAALEAGETKQVPGLALESIERPRSTGQYTVADVTLPVRVLYTVQQGGGCVSEHA